MSENTNSNNKWIPPVKIESLYASTNGNKFSSINAPTAGARIEKELPRGNALFQYYSIATPNGQKPAILLEELGIDYDAHRTFYFIIFIDIDIDININIKILLVFLYC